MTNIINKLFNEHTLSDEEFTFLLNEKENNDLLAEKADITRKKIYGNDVYVRGLIEISSFCRNDCFYCGLRCSNKKAERYRLTDEEIISCCNTGYALGLRTFVLQGGEDVQFTDKRVCSLISSVKDKYPDCAVTLSLGEKTKESYRSFKNAGADRYLLRHETADDGHYGRLHPSEMSLHNRKRCLYDLKELGFQVGAGGMIRSPFQTIGDLISDLRFLEDLQPEMIGIGPFIHHNDTPFANFPDGSVELTLKMISVLRLMFPEALIPATTALGTLRSDGRELGLKAGANVVMPNLSPVSVRKKYSIYENKICTGEESAECIRCLESRIRSAGFEMSFSRGDHIKLQQRCT